MVVRLRILLINEVRVIRAYQFYSILLRKLHQHAISLLLQREGLAIGKYARICHLMALQFKIIVISPDIMIPFHSLTSPLNITFDDFLRHLSADTCRADYEVLMKCGKILSVSSRTTIISVHPRA